MAVAVAVAVAVSGGGAVAVAVAVAGLTKRFFNHIQKNFLINIWGYFFSVRKKREILFRSSIKDLVWGARGQSEQPQLDLGQDFCFWEEPEDPLSGHCISRGTRSVRELVLQIALLP